MSESSTGAGGLEIDGPVRRLTRGRLRAPDGERGGEHDPLLAREWLVTNGRGGYASGSLSGTPTRRYHALLVSALPAPIGRARMLAHLSEVVGRREEEEVPLTALERTGGGVQLPGAENLAELRLESGIPVWRYELGAEVLERRIWMVHHRNTVYVGYRLVSGEPLRLELRPFVHFAPHDRPVSRSGCEAMRVAAGQDRCEIEDDSVLPALRLVAFGEGAEMVAGEARCDDVLYRTEKARGYDHVGSLWSPGSFRLQLSAGRDAGLVASTESWETLSGFRATDALDAELARRARLLDEARVENRRGAAAELVLAADQFIIEPVDRLEEAARLRASGDELRTILAGYHWFTDWGRDTMISLEGLTLRTGRHAEARSILRAFADMIQDGLIPNLVPEGDEDGLYHTADATLWFFHALHRYVEATGDGDTRSRLLPALRDVVARHVAGTRFGIGVDPEDGLLRQGAEGYQLTWMDAKVDGWVVTPRRGKAVEINALWYNALVLLSEWLDHERSSDAEEIRLLAERVRSSFNQRFWYERGGYLYDVVDGETGDDDACRPNQIFAISLDRPVLDPRRFRSVMDVVRDRLWTPVGLRSLSPDHPAYQRSYAGDLRARDAAYHQGTVWAWLVGPFVDAWRKSYPDDEPSVRRLLAGLLEHLDDGAIGTVGEIFDAEPPFLPRGCVAQAWSVAEVLRVISQENVP